AGKGAAGQVLLAGVAEGVDETVLHGLGGGDPAAGGDIGGQLVWILACRLEQRGAPAGGAAARLFGVRGQIIATRGRHIDRIISQMDASVRQRRTLSSSGEDEHGRAARRSRTRG